MFTYILIFYFFNRNGLAQMTVHKNIPINSKEVTEEQAKNKRKLYFINYLYNAIYIVHFEIKCIKYNIFK